MKYNELIKTMNTISVLAGNGETKIQKKLIKLFEKLKVYYSVYEEKVEEIRLDNASVDEKGNLIVDEKKGYKYSKEGLKKLNSAVKELAEKDFEYKKIEIINKEGFDKMVFLKDFVEGIEFINEEEEEL
jgi:hypothetical protein